MSLQLIRFRPNALAFQRWGHNQRLLQRGADTGYAWHAVMRAALGDDAPQPFAVRGKDESLELLAYSDADTRLWKAMAQDKDAIDALALERIDVKALPENLCPGDRLSFEVRVRPVIRSRSGRNNSRELDAAVLAKETDPSAQREASYRKWLDKELGRDGAAKLVEAPRMVSFRRTRVLRRTQAATSGRQLKTIEGPDVLFRGLLEIADAEAFYKLLARGLGRHRAFGFGCLLLAPPGALR